MKLHNTLTRSTEDFVPLNKGSVRMYSCGPTVYDHIHIGNLSAFITADVLRRVLVTTHGYEVKHVMNITDVDDKTIQRSRERYPDDSPEEALTRLTNEYEQIFLDDMAAIGNDIQAMQFVRATKNIEGMRALIRELYEDDYAYVTSDGVYFSLDKYRNSGRTYGQLLKLDDQNTSAARIENDEYDKDSLHDFALWKLQKIDEPSWPFELAGSSLQGRPGWHIECSVMSVHNLGQPFDIHTGGVDLIFPHHENEIAQSTAGKDKLYAKYFVHNEHLLVDGQKMSKSLNNFYTLRDVRESAYEPLAFRLLVLQSHYRKQSSFSWENLDAAQNRLSDLRAMADLVHQPGNTGVDGLSQLDYAEYKDKITEALQYDLNTPLALKAVSDLATDMLRYSVRADQLNYFRDLLHFIDEVFGLDLAARKDINDRQKLLLTERQNARDNKEWDKSDNLRDQLKQQGVGLRDTDFGQIWFRL